MVYFAIWRRNLWKNRKERPDEIEKSDWKRGQK
jgi:hypothetical protein